VFVTLAVFSKPIDGARTTRPASSSLSSVESTSSSVAQKTNQASRATTHVLATAKYTLNCRKGTKGTGSATSRAGSWR